MSKSIFPHELIGECIEVVEAKNTSIVGVHGEIIDETKFTLVVDCHGKNKTLLKNAIKFKLKRSGKIIDGADIIKRPEERVKGKK